MSKAMKLSGLNLGFGDFRSLRLEAIAIRLKAITTSSNKLLGWRPFFSSPQLIPKSASAGVGPQFHDSGGIAQWHH